MYLVCFAFCDFQTCFSSQIFNRWRFLKIALISSRSREPNMVYLLISWAKCIVTPLPHAHLQLLVSLKKQGVQSLLVSFHIFTVSTTVHRSPAVMCAFCFVFSIQTGHHGRSQTCSEIREAVLSDKRGTLWCRAGEGSSRGLISHINGADWIVEIMALPVIRCPGEQHRENGPQTEERWDKGWLCPQACIKALVVSLIPQCPLPHIGLRAHKSHGPTTTWTKTTFIPIRPCSCSSSGTNKTAPFLPNSVLVVVDACGWHALNVSWCGDDFRPFLRGHFISRAQQVCIAALSAGNALSVELLTP